MEIMSYTQSDVDKLLQLFKPFDTRLHLEKYKVEYPKNILRKASVLIPICVINGEFHVVLTVRSEKLTHHAGYVAFPGGMQDDTDEDDIHTALREAEEEIGLKPEQVKVICTLSPGLVKPNTLVHPVVGLILGDFSPAINEDEVSLVFKLPLKRFLSTEGRRISDFNAENNSVFHTHHFIDNIEGREVDTWGYTAMLCASTALVVLQSDQTFCFYNDKIITKDNVFEPSSVQAILKNIFKMASKY